MGGGVIVIRDWAKHFEKSDTKKCQSTKWVPTPNKWDGKSYRRIMRMPDGIQIFGAWILLVQAASRCPMRGVLQDDDGPLTSADLADKTGCPQKVFERAIEVLRSKEIGWIHIASATEVAGNFRDAPENPGLQDRTGQDITKQDRLHPTDACSEPLSKSDSEQPSADEAVVMMIPCVGKGPTEWPLTEAKVAEYRISFPAVDVLGECRKARQWCLDNPTKRKTYQGVARFLSSWLGRVQDQGNRSNGQSTRNGSGQRYIPGSNDPGAGVW